jgi:hypothetical protein
MFTFSAVIRVGDNPSGSSNTFRNFKFRLRARYLRHAALLEAQYGQGRVTFSSG